MVVYNYNNSVNVYKVYSQRPYMYKVLYRCSDKNPAQLVIAYAIQDKANAKPTMRFCLTNNRELIALIDTGANNSMINEERTKQLRLPIKRCTTRQL